MKKGDVIGGYRVVTDPTNADGGKCMWAFAEKDGTEYFLKRFLEPKRPREGSGSAASRRIRLETCEEFEDRHRGIMKLLRPDVSGAGNLVLATDFFHSGSTYYKVTERIDTTTLDRPESLAPKQKAVLLKTLGASLRLLHDIDVVHGDLKPANVLVQKREGAAFHSAKLIDFDDSYPSGKPPGRDDIAGDSLYGAPEWRRYVQGDEAVEGPELTTAVDIFALGLMTHHYLTGALPAYDSRFGSPADAVNAGEPLEVDDRLGTPMQALIMAMTAAGPTLRPTGTEFFARLKDPEVCTLHTSPQPRPAADAADSGNAAKPRGSRVTFNPPDRSTRPVPAARTTGDEPAESVESPEASEERAPGTDETSEPPAGTRRSRVRINLGDRAAGGSGP
ncbi:lipopolysaccharide kinase InaA family protein [Streptomyces sp. YIM 130001]|uniref:protein kinase domain-containing protein n=1 Tax=Streptomyces sp. YIM 130001 TaxID=2259644 RepID=UPI000E654FD7|nr:lipopolysaccharide kinase InaA family protein [Streptomyces sp. YIM 130001]